MISRRLFWTAIILAVSLLYNDKALSLIKTPNLAGAWRFESSANDWSGNGTNGTVTGATLATGKFGQCYSFDGTDDWIDFTTNESLFDVAGSSFTVAVWVKISSLQTGIFLIIDKRHGFGDYTGWLIQAGTNGIPDFAYGDGVGWTHAIGFGVDIRDDQWHYLVGVYDGITLKSYLDGVLKNTYNATASPADNNRNLEIGSSWGGGTRVRYVKGLIDEVRFFNRAMTAAEIRALMLNYDPGEF